MFDQRLIELRARLSGADIDVALITDDDSVYYLTGYYDYLHMDFGRPTILVVPYDGESLLITPSMEMGMAEAAARVDRIVAWNDGLGDEWRAELPALLSGSGCVAFEPDKMPPLVRNFIGTIIGADRLVAVTPIVAEMRMIKSSEELQLARHAGEVAMAMMDAGRAAIGVGVAEYEVALATSSAGTRKAAELLAGHYDDGCMSPNTHFLQIMASGDEITKPHHRASREDYPSPLRISALAALPSLPFLQKNGLRHRSSALLEALQALQVASFPLRSNCGQVKRQAQFQQRMPNLNHLLQRQRLLQHNPP